MSDDYGTCKCGFTAPTFEQARIHVLSRHGGAQRVSPWFGTDEDGDDTK